MLSGKTLDVPLLYRPNCTEGRIYYVGLYKEGSPDPGALCIDTSYAIQPSYAAVNSSAKLRWFGTAISEPYAEFSSSRYPTNIYPGDLRLSVYSVTWGDQEFTNHFRRRYMTYVVQYPPTGTWNNFQLYPAYGDSMGNGLDELSQTQLRASNSARVVIYRIAAVMGRKSGYIGGIANSPYFTDQYPVLQSLSAFKVATCKGEGANIIIDLLKADLSPQPQDASYGSILPWVVKAAYSTVDVTTNNRLIQWPFENQFTSNLPITSAVLNNGVDPWNGVVKQLTICMGYTPQGIRYLKKPTAYQFRTFVQNEGALSSDIMDLPFRMASPRAQLPNWGYDMYERVTSTGKMVFRNAISQSKPVDCWPKILLPDDTVLWQGRVENAEKYRIGKGMY